MRLSTSLLTDRMPRRTRHVPRVPRVPESNPYRRMTSPAAAVSDALWLDDAERILHERRQPAFTPAPARDTAPIPALREHPAPRPDAPSPELLARVHGAMRDRWRAETFVADKRSLPAFDAATRIQGWQGLHMPSRPVTHQRWTTERWYAQAMRANEAAVGAAMTEAEDAIDAARARVAAGTRHDTPVPQAAPRDGWLREALAEATWGAHRWYAGRDEDKALTYEDLHGAVVSAADDASALAAARAFIGDGKADADDLTGPSGILAGPLAGGAR